jgi:hypothetical protein
MSDSRRIPIEQAASTDELDEAVNALTPVEWRRLRNYAQYLLHGLGRGAENRTWKDLVNETILAFYRPDGRRWKKDEVDIVRTITLAMRSVASMWRRKFESGADVSLESDLTVNKHGETQPYSIEQAPGWRPSAEREFEYKKMLDEIDRLAATRELAPLIIQGMREEMSGPEIRELLNISENAYETEMVWIRRTMRTAFPNRK